MTLSSYWSFVSRTSTFLSKTSSMNRSRVQTIRFPSQPHCSQPLHGVLRTKSSKSLPLTHLGSGAGLWMTPLSSTREVNKQGFLQHINSVDPALKFRVEENKEDGSIPFLDTIVKPEADGTLSITVYRKPTHTDQYLQWDSHHHL